MKNLNFRNPKLFNEVLKNISNALISAQHITFFSTWQVQKVTSIFGALFFWVSEVNNFLGSLINEIFGCSLIFFMIFGPDSNREFEIWNRTGY